MIWTYVKLAWRNIFRNKRRSFLAGAAIGIGLASLIFVDALVIGMKQNMIHSATSSYLGEGQIHGEGFRKTQEVERTINQLDWVSSNLRQETIVEHFTLRVMSFAMISSPSNMSAINLVGVIPSSERHLSQIDEALKQGAYFEEKAERNIIIGSKLAELLEVELRDRIVITVAQAETGDLSQEMFRVSGIYRFHVREREQGSAFIRLEKAQQMLGIGEGIHEVAIKFTNPQFGQDERLPFWKKYSRYGNEAEGWTEILPQVQAALEISSFSTYIVGLILFGVVALGIINTLFMSLHERIFEFGVLRAVGTRPLGIAQLIIFEAGALAVLSIGLGIIMGFLITFITSKVGIDYTGIEFAGMTFRELLYPVLKIRQFLFYPFWVFVFTEIAGIYPAAYAAKMAPADAMRKSM
jgi:ABC-type lipoprotein release transport system permease subunit